MLALAPSLANLATVLRHREMWPEGFEWDYRNCQQCAIGLTARLWHGTLTPLTEGDMIQMMRDLGPETPDHVLIRIFYDANLVLGYRPDDRGAITPEHVASLIDRFLAQRTGE